MEFDPAKLRRLGGFGLSAYGAKAYLALLQLGTTDARAVSDLAHIPTAKVYATLAQLEQRGLAEVALGKPRKYAPIPMEDFLARERRAEEERLAALDAERESLLHLFPILGTTAVSERARMTSVTGRRNVVQRIRDACRGARRDIFLSVDQKFGGSDEPFWRALEDATARGVKVRFAKEPAPDELAMLDAVFPGPATTTAGGSAEAGAVIVATFDDDLAMFVRLAHSETPRAAQKDVAICTGDVAFVAPIRRLIALRCLGAGTSTAAPSEPRAFTHVSDLPA